MTSNRPYLIRALYEWISDNDLTPYVLVDAMVPGAEVPEGYVENGRIILNMAARAVKHLELTNDAVSFEARFGGQPMRIYVPIKAVMAIYAQENGQGMFFGDEPEENSDHPVVVVDESTNKDQALGLESGNQAGVESPGDRTALFSVVEGGASVASESDETSAEDSSGSDDDPDGDGPGPGGSTRKRSSKKKHTGSSDSDKRPALRVVK